MIPLSSASSRRLQTLTRVRVRVRITSPSRWIQLISAASSTPSSAAKPSSSAPTSHSTHAGIVIGATVVGVIALCLLLAITFRFRKRRKTSNLTSLKDAKPSNDTKQQAMATSNYGVTQEMPDHYIPYEADSRARLELDSRSRGGMFAESTVPRSELDDSSRNRRD